jgi:hypothetical protein
MIEGMAVAPRLWGGVGYIELQYCLIFVQIGVLPLHNVVSEF